MRLKKAFAVILAIAMVFGAVSLASAAPTVGGFADAAENKQSNQIAYLKALGVAKGDENGNYNPDAALTRQEFVTFVARLAGQEAAAEFMAGIPSRYLDDEDIADWARGPVNLADTNGWVQGYDDGKFHPTDTLTYAQAVTVLIRVLGHEAVVTGAWPNAHIVKGINLGLNAGVSLSANTPISRADMGRLLYNALFIKQLEQTGDNKWEAGESLMASRTVEGEVTNVTANAKTITIQTGVDEDDDPIYYTRDFDADVVLIGAETSNVHALRGLDVRLTVSSSVNQGSAKVTVVEVIDGVSTGAVLTFEKFDTIAAAADNNWTSSTVIVLSDGSKVEYDNTDENTATVRVNGSPLYTPGQDDEPTWAQALRKGDWVVVTQSSGKVKHVEVTHFDVNDQLLQDDGKAKTTANNYNRIALTGANDVINVAGANITLNGSAAGVGDLKEDDVVNVALVYAKWDHEAEDEDENPDPQWAPNTTKAPADPAGKNIAHTVVATRNTVKGEVTGKRVTFPGPVVYTTLKLADGSTKEYKWVSGTNPDHVAGAGEATLRLNAAGNVVGLVGLKGTLEDGAYAILKGAAQVGTTKTITVDVNGTEHTLAVDKDSTIAKGGDIDTDLIGHAVLLEMNGAIVEYADTGLAGSDAGWTVDVVDTAANKVVISKGAATNIIEGALIYKNDAGKPGDAVTLKVGDTVTAYYATGDTPKEAKMLLRTATP